MKYKFQLSPTSSTREPLRMPIRHKAVTPPVDWDDAKFLRSWLIYDSDLEATRTHGRLNWNMIAGLAVTAVVSAAGWAGIALLVRHFVK
jgi:hypothetical protein